MSSLYKLLILGVRSFSPKDHETIQFGSPLTLICGQNGCGKTTIIECLKYATTGDLPPNSKGGAFVNDPAIADRLMVNAEIKLGFISVDGKLMTVTRNMQFTRKRNARGQAGSSNTFKTLEGQLAVISRGHKTAISTKNLELDTRIPLYLGASKAILEYVIFCHQDDSLWPLSEAGVLKRRFDEIFEAMKFTKVLENLKNIRKEMATDIKLIEQSVQHAKVDKVRAQKIKEKLTESTNKVERYSEEIAELTMQIEALEKKADELFHSNQSFQKTLSEFERLKMVFENVQTNYKRLQNSIEILPDSDEDLAHQLANFAEIQKQKSSALQEKEEQTLEVAEKLQEIQKEFHRLTRDEGFLANKKQEYEGNTKRFLVLETTICKEYNLSSNDSLIEELDKLLELVNSRYSRLVEENSSKQDLAAKKVRDVENRISQEEQHKSYCSDDISNNSSRIKDLKSKLASLSLNEESMEMEKSELESLKSRLHKRKLTSNVKEMQTQIENDTSELSLLESELDDLMKKISTANKQSDLYGKIDLLRDSANVKRDIVSKSVATNKDSFKQRVGQDLSVETCETVLDSEIQKESRMEKEHQKSVEEIKAKLNSANAHIKIDGQSLVAMEGESKEGLTKILKVLEEAEIPQYESLLQELEDNYKAAIYNSNTFDVTKSYKIKAVEIAKQTKCCTLCTRGFEGAEVDNFIKELQANIHSLTAEKLQEDVDGTKKDLEEMKSINFDVLEYRKRKPDLAALRAKVAALEIEREDCRAELVEATQLLESRKSQVEDLMELKKPISNLARVSEDLLSIEKQILNLEEELGDYGASTMSMAELQKLHQQRNFEVKSLRLSIAEATEEANVQQKELSRLEGQIKDKQLLLSDLKNSLNEGINIKNSIRDLEAHVETLTEKQERIDTVLNELQEKQKEHARELQKITKECHDLELESSKELDALVSRTSTCKKLHDDIKQFEDHDSEKVRENTEKLEEAKAEIQSLNNKRTELEKTTKELQKTINEASRIERNMQDNIEYRATEKELDQIQQRIDELDVSNAEIERENYQNDSKALRDQITTLHSRHSGKVGEVKQINDQIRQFQTDLNSEFKDIDKLYHKEWIKLQTNLLVSNDLQTYSQALDNAIMKYHGMKMDEINRILRELWNQTYKGTDIDSIEIKCDVNTQARGRSYNYRVVMFKKNSELDMRGRCSAGQKVLTSILIRLALAECFGTNCGMIALDEPTTNLDVENAESLANALNSIIAFRKNQKNFQLIVITHDEKFLSHINGDSYIDNFYRISRDENQHSVIKSLPIHLMQDE